MTPATLQIADRIHFSMPCGGSDFPHVRARLPAHISNLLATHPTPVEEGMAANGIATPTYGQTLTAALNTWRIWSLRGWQNECAFFHQMG